MGCSTPRLRLRDILSAPLPVPKVWQVADSAWQIRLPLPWSLSSVNVFLFARRDGFLLLDSGLRTDESLRSLEAALRSLNLNWESITEILISHLHPDHVGAAAEIRRRSQAPVRMHSLEARYVQPLGPDRKYFAETANFLLRNGIPDAVVETMRRASAAGAKSFERLQVDGSIDDGERIKFRGGTLHAIVAPGHSPALLCFYCPEQQALFSTDAILPRVTPNIGVHWFYQGNPLGDYLQSLAALEKLEVRSILPSHGKPFDGHRAWIGNTRQHHARRCESILAVLQDEPLHGFEIASLIRGRDRSLLDLRFATAESLAHLEYMALQDLVYKVQLNGVAHWTRISGGPAEIQPRNEATEFLPQQISQPLDGSGG